MFTVKNFGNNVQCASAEELKTALVRDYAGKSVSIAYPGKSGMSRTLFVDVANDGVVTSSYGAQEVVDLDSVCCH